MPTSPHDVSWLPPLEERAHTTITVKLHDNKARKGDADYKAPGATPGHGLPKDSSFEGKHPRGGKGSTQGGKFVKKGDTGSEVETIQKQLGITIDGRYDAGTAAAVVAFQQRHGLEADGVIGRQTALALTGQFSRARRVGPGPLGPYTSKLVGGDSRSKAKKAKKKAAPAERVGGGLLVAGESPFLRENVVDHLGNVHDLLGKFAPKLGGKGGGHHAASIPEYDPKHLTFGKLAGGSNGARIATHTDGSKWLVKTYKGGENRVATELLANAVYREVGARVPRAGRIKLKNGKQALAYPLLDGAPRPGVFQRPGAQPSSELGDHFMVDALLANWDVVGLEDDNILWDKGGQPFRVDQGGTLEYRAMGGRKDFGPIPYEVTTMLTGSGQARRGHAVTPEGMRAQARKIAETLTPGRIDQLVSAAGFKDEGMRERVRGALKARVGWMASFSQGSVSLPSPPKLVEDEDAFWLAEAEVINFDWNPHLHPRDNHGKFIEKLGISGGAKIQLDSKTFLARDKDGTYRVVRSGGITKGFSTPEDAVRAALDKSAKAKDADSLGGATSYADFNAYLKAQVAHDVKDTVDKKGIPGENAAFFGGKKVSGAKLQKESARLQTDLANAKASSDKYVQRQVPTLKARLKEANDKLKALGFDLPQPDGTPVTQTPAAKALGDMVGSKDLDALPVGSKVSASTHTWTKQANGMWKGNKSGATDIPSSSFTTAKAYKITQLGYTPPPAESLPKVGEKLTKPEQLDALPIGSSIGYNGAKADYIKTPDGKWKWANTPGDVGLYTTEDFAGAIGSYKVVALGGGDGGDVSTPEAAGAKAAAQLKVGTTFTNSAGAKVKVTKNQGDVLTLEVHPPGGGKTFETTTTHKQAGDVIAGGAWHSFTPPGTAASNAVGGTGKTVASHADMKALPIGSKIEIQLQDGSGETIEWEKTGANSWAKIKHGGLVGTETVTTATFGFVGGPHKVTFEPQQAPSLGVGSKVASAAEMDALPVGAKVALPGSGNVYTKQADGKWSLPGGVSYPASDFGFNNIKVESLPGATPATPTKKVSGPQENNVGGLGATWLKDLDIAEGDVIQPSGAGGWKYKVTKVNANGSVMATSPKGKSKLISAYSKPKLITKADKTPLALKATPAPAASGPVAAAPQLTPAQIEAKLETGGTATIGSFPEGTVIGTPDGKIGVLKPSEPAYTGYVTAYDIKTGQKFEAPAGKVPVKHSQLPSVKAAAAAQLAEKHKQTKVTVAGGAHGTQSVAASAVGPPVQHQGVASNFDAKQFIGGVGTSSYGSSKGKDGPHVTLNSTEREAVKHYTGSGYKTINGQLRNSKSVGSIETARRIKALDTAIAKSTVTEDVVIGRRTDNSDWLTSAQTGAIVHDNGFMSASVDPNQWSGQINLRILIRAGSNALYVDGISSNAGEDEVLLPRGAQYHVLKREETGGKVVLYVEML